MADKQRTHVGMLLTEGQIADLITKFKDSEHGVKTSNVNVRLRMHSNCFTGATAVDWCMFNAAMMDVTLNKDQSSELAQMFLDRGVFASVSPGQTLFEVDRLYKLPSTSAGLSDEEIDNLVIGIQGDGGIEVRDRVHRLVVHKNCFVGSEFVEWLAKNENMEVDRSCEIGSMLMSRGFFRSANTVKRSSFDNDQKAFYTFQVFPVSKRERLQAQYDDITHQIEIEDKSIGGLVMLMTMYASQGQQELYDGVKQEHDNGKTHLDELKTRQEKIEQELNSFGECESGMTESVQATVIYAYEATQEDELSITVGQSVKVTDQKDPGWWRGEVDGKSGLFPATYVEVVKVVNKGAKYVALWDYEPQGQSEVALTSGGGIIVLDKSGTDGWWRGRVVATGEEGLFPASYVEVEQEKEEKEEKPVVIAPTLTVSVSGKPSTSRPLPLHHRPNLPPSKRLPSLPSGPIPPSIAERERKRKEELKKKEEEDLGMSSRVIYDYNAENEGELPLVAGDTVTNITKDESGWWTGVSNGVTGVFPANYVADGEEHGGAVSIEQVKIAQYSYEATSVDEMSVDEGDRITVMQLRGDGWAWAKKGDKQGLIPEDYLVDPEEHKPAKTAAKLLSVEEGGRKRASSISARLSGAFGGWKKEKEEKKEKKEEKKPVSPAVAALAPQTRGRSRSLFARKTQDNTPPPANKRAIAANAPRRDVYIRIHSAKNVSGSGSSVACHVTCVGASTKKMDGVQFTDDPKWNAVAQLPGVPMGSSISIDIVAAKTIGSATVGSTSIPLPSTIDDASMIKTMLPSWYDCGGETKLCAQAFFLRRVVLLGKSGAGKTKVKLRLQLGMDVPTVPTKGKSTEKLSINGYPCDVTDLSGSDQEAAVSNAATASGLIYVVDGEDIDGSKAHLETLLTSESLAASKTPILVLINKTDAVDLDLDDVKRRLGLSSLCAPIGREHEAFLISAKNGGGVERAISWLLPTFVVPT